MRIAIIVLAALLLLGCTGERGSPANSTANATNLSNVTNATLLPQYVRFTASSFSFDYPSDMAAENSISAYGGTFSAKHELAGRTGEFLVVAYANTSATYGANADRSFQANPDLTAARFLEESELNDSAGFLENATEIGPVTLSTIGRDAFIAEAPFMMEYAAGTYTGYALSMYVPARSLQVQARILALDPDVAKQIRNEFLLSFRVE